MTGTAALIGGWTPISDHNAIPGMIYRPLAASAQVGKGQFVTVDPTTGYADLNNGTSPNQIAVGNGDYSELSDTSTIAGNALVRLSQRWCYGLSNGTSTDALTDTDYAVPFYIGAEATAGKLSHTGADGTLVNRSLGGLCFGIKTQDGTPVLWSSPVAWLLARATCAVNATVIARDAFALTGNTTRAETSIPRETTARARVTQVRIMADAGFTAHDTNYWTITVAKRTATTPGTAVTIATKTLKITGGTGNLTAWLPADLTLSATSAALDLLETDVITVTCTAESTAAAIARFTVEVIGKVGG